MVLVDPLDVEDLVLVDFLVDGELACLSEALAAACVGALEWFLAGVGVGVLLEVLGECELLVADEALELPVLLVGGDMSAEGETCAELLVTALDCAHVRPFHVFLIKLHLRYLNILISQVPNLR